MKDTNQKNYFHLPLSLELALHILWRRNRRHWKDTPLFGAFIGITMSIIPLVLVIEVSDGMIHGILNRFIETLYSHITLNFYPERNRADIQEIQRRINDIPGVYLTNIEYRGAGLALVNENRSAVEIRAVEPDIYQKDLSLQKYLKIENGSFNLNSNGILLASDIAFKLNLKVGDPIILITGAQFGETRQLRPSLREFQIMGIVSTGYQELDRLWAFISLESAQSFLHFSNSSLQIHVKVLHPYDFKKLNNIMAEIEQILPAGSARIQSWNDSTADLNQTYQFTKSILIYIMYLIIGVGAINIASSMVMLVLENSQDIAIMKALGARGFLIQSTYLWVSLIISLLAIFCGFTLGLLLSLFINEVIAALNYFVNWIYRIFGHSQSLDVLDKSFYLEKISINFEGLPLLYAALVIVSLTLLFSILPAFKAAKMLPLEILRKNR